jgi:hypothetical protein
MDTNSYDGEIPNVEIRINYRRLTVAAAVAAVCDRRLLR